jgi:hypothetical protein
VLRDGLMLGASYTGTLPIEHPTFVTNEDFMDLDNRAEQIPTEQAAPEDEELVAVLDTKEESEAMVVHGLLESNGIEALVSYLDAPQDVLPGVGGIVVKVRASEADRARTVIEDFRRSGGADVESISEEPMA